MPIDMQINLSEEIVRICRNPTDSEKIEEVVDVAKEYLRNYRCRDIGLGKLELWANSNKICYLIFVQKGGVYDNKKNNISHTTRWNSGPF